MFSTHTSRTSRLRSDAGATLAEYALGFSLIVAASVVGIVQLNSAAEREAANQADCISTRPPPESCARRPVPAPPEVAEPGDPPDPDDETPPPTDPPATTTTMPPPPSTVETGDPVATLDPNGTWRFSVEFTLTDPDGAPVEGATFKGRVQIGQQGFGAACAATGAGTYVCQFEGIPPENVLVRFDVIDIASQPPVERPFPSIGIERPDEPAPALP